MSDMMFAQVYALAVIGGGTLIYILFLWAQKKTEDYIKEKFFVFWGGRKSDFILYELEETPRERIRKIERKIAELQPTSKKGKS